MSKPHASTISRLLNDNGRYGRDFRVRGHHNGTVRVLSLSRDSQEGAERLAARGYLIEREDRNVFFVTGKTDK